MINNNTDGLSFVCVTAIRVDTSLNNNGGMPKEGLGGVSYNTFYYNHLQREVTVIDRTGLRVTLGPFKGPASNRTFTIRRIYTISAYGGVSNNNREECLHLISNMIGIKSSELEFINESLSHKKIGYNEDVRVGIDYSVTEEELYENKGSIYVTGCDKVVTLLPAMKAHAHPYAVGTTSEDTYYKTLGIGGRVLSMGLGVRLINKRKDAVDMYMNTFNGIRAIKPLRGADQDKDGFYITEPVESYRDGEMNLEWADTKYYPLSDSALVGIYSTREEAIAKGDVAGQNALEITRLKEEANIYKINSEKTTGDLRMKIIESDRETRDEINRLAIIKAERELENFKLTTAADELNREFQRKKIAFDELKLSHDATINASALKENKLDRELSEEKIKFERLRLLHEQQILEQKNLNEENKRKYEKEIHDRNMEILEADRLHKLEMARLTKETAKIKKASEVPDALFKLVGGVLTLLGLFIKFKS